MNNKECVMCRRILPATNDFFSIQHGCFATRCKECRVKRENERFRKIEQNNIKNGISLDGKKRCKCCGILKEKKDFVVFLKSIDGLTIDCRLCRNAKHRKTILGVDEKIFNNILSIQENKCAICKKELSVIADRCLDHNHKNKKIRGILCFKCNVGLGSFKDNPLFLEQAIDYLNSDDKGFGEVADNRPLRKNKNSRKSKTVKFNIPKTKFDDLR